MDKRLLVFLAGFIGALGVGEVLKNSTSATIADLTTGWLYTSIIFLINYGIPVVLIILMMKHPVFHYQGNDPVYSLVNLSKKSKYQECFIEILDKIDIDNETKRIKKLSYDKLKSEEDWNAIVVSVELFEKYSDLKGVVVLVMVLQFLYADEISREMDRHQWLEKVMNREKIDYFPDSRWIINTLDA